MINNYFFCIFDKVSNLFLHQSYLNTPNQIELIKNANNYFLIFLKIQK